MINQIYVDAFDGRDHEEAMDLISQVEERAVLCTGVWSRIYLSDDVYIAYADDADGLKLVYRTQGETKALIEIDLRQHYENSEIAKACYESEYQLAMSMIMGHINIEYFVNKRMTEGNANA